jgi:hypothetical protein
MLGTSYANYNREAFIVMNILSKLKSIARNKVMLGAAVGILLGAGVLMGTTGAASAETYNCDSNAVMYCGAPSVSKLISNYNNGISGHETPNSIHDVYSYFGISSSDVKSMTSTVQMGIVKKNGQVYVGSKLVASSALTAGRSYISGSKTVHYGVTTFYTRAPSVSFLDDSLDAYVVMVNNQFKFAILVSCGNPVTGVPTPTPITPKPVLTPKYTINKLVAVQGSSNYSKDVSVKSGAIVDYKITVASTGNTPVTNLNVSDKLPADVEYVGGTLQEDGKAANSNDLFNSHIAVGTLKNGTSTVFTFEAKVGYEDTTATCKTATLTNSANMVATGLGATSSSANVEKACQPAPTPCYQCTSLTADQTAANAYNFTAKASASNGATITGYVFNYGDGKTQTVTTSNDSATASHAYSTTATFNVTVAALVSVNGKTQTVTSANCGTTVKPVCPLPEGQCTDVKLVQNAGNPREVTATATYTTVNGATLTGVSFNWGDSTVTPASAQTAATHTYQADGNYTVVATLTFSSPSATVASANCQAPITITTVTPTCDELDVNVNNTSMTVTVTNLQYTANNGTYENTTLDWGDGSTPVTAANVNGQTHTYTANGPFTIVATANFSVNGTDTPVTSTTCQQTVSFTQTPVTPVTPATPTTTTPAPTELVSTGAGNVVGLFIAAMIVGVVGYYFYMNRRLSREG